MSRARTAWRWLPALAWMAAIFMLSSQSGLRVSEDDAVDRPLRTLAHVVAYAALAGLLLAAISGGRRPTIRDALLAIAIATLYGISDEIHQAFVPDRSGRLQDVLIDAAGAVIGAAAALLLLSRRGALHRPG